MNGVLIIDKPQGLTSHDVVSRVRKVLGQHAVGHLGTLDPMATGVLPLVLGSFTRLAQFYLRSEKTYEGVIRFGFSTSTYDAEGEPDSPVKQVNLGLEEVRAVAAGFVGSVEQLPPPFSAKKIAGVPAYKLARKKEEVPLRPVKVEIKEFAILEVKGDRADFKARVGSGTYMRSVAHDLGQKIGCGAHLAELRRTGVAELRIEAASTLKALADATQQGRAKEMLVHPRKLVPDLPCVTATEEDVAMIRAGRAVNLPEMSRAPLVKVFLGQADLVAIATRVAGTLFHAGTVFASETGEE